MGIRGPGSAAALLVCIASVLPSGASDSHYFCEDSAPVAVSLELPLVSAVEGSGPACDFVVTCPTTATACVLTGTASVRGLGWVGLFMIMFGVSGAECNALVFCAASPGAGPALGPGEQASVSCRFARPSSTTIPLTAAAFAKIQCHADMTF
jgi:hypothetical protein